MDKPVRKWMFFLWLLVLATACQDVPLEEQIVGRWVEHSRIEAVVVEFQEDGTVVSADRPLLDGAQYEFTDDQHLRLTVPQAGDSQTADHELAVRIDDDQLMLTEAASGQETVYSRVNQPDDLAVFLVARWERIDDTAMSLEFFADGRVALGGVSGLSDGVYTLTEQQHIQLKFDGGQVQDFEIITTRDMFILRNDIDQSLTFARAE